MLENFRQNNDFHIVIESSVMYNTKARVFMCTHTHSGFIIPWRKSSDVGNYGGETEREEIFNVRTISFNA